MSRNMDDNKKQLPYENEVNQGKCISTDLTGNVETVVLLGNQKTKPDSHIKLSVDMDEFNKVKNGEK